MTRRGITCPICKTFQHEIGTPVATPGGGRLVTLECRHRVHVKAREELARG